MITGTLSRSPIYPTMPHMVVRRRRIRKGLLDALFCAVIGDPAFADFAEGRRDGLVRVDRFGQRRRTVVELFGPLRYDVDEREFGVDVREQAVEVAEYGVTH